MIQQQIYLNQPLDASEDALAFEAMKEVGPEAISLLPIILSSKDAFYSPFLSDWHFETWKKQAACASNRRPTPC